MAEGTGIVETITGSRNLERLDKNIGALAVELPPGDLREIESAFSKVTSSAL